jgi:ABC-type sugar transport system ATPase subunit
MKGLVYSVEPLGESSIVTLEVNGQKIFAELAGSSEEEEGNVVVFSFHKEKAHIFNASTGKSIKE